MEQYLFNLGDPTEMFDGKVEVKPNLWLISTVEIPPILFSAEEVGRMLGISRCRVYELLRRKEIRSVRVGSLRRVSAGAIREFVDSLEAQAAS